MKATSPVRIQWDPERDIRLQPLDHRAIQIGLSGVALERLIADWITRIEDVTPLAHTVHERVSQGDDAGARALLPEEHPYEPAA